MSLDFRLHLVSVFQCSCLLCLCQDGEKKGVSPEEVYISMRVAKDSSSLPCKWLKTELPLLLDQIKMLVAMSSLQPVSDKTSTEHAVSMLLSVIIEDY